MMQGMRLTRPSLAAASALMLAACGISPPADVAGVRRAVGDVLPGAQGLTISDQERIDETVARGCASGIWSRPQCARHTEASAARRRALDHEATAPAGV